MEEIKSIQLFQIGLRTVVGIFTTEKEYEDECKEIGNIDIPIHSFVLIKHPMLLMEFLVSSPLDESRQVLTQQLKPFFGNPKYFRINIPNTDFGYSISDPELIKTYKKIVESIDFEREEYKKQTKLTSY